MVRLRAYEGLTPSPSGQTFSSVPRKRARVRTTRAPVTPALKAAMAKQREERRIQYQAALKNARDVIHQHAVHLRETFGGHSVDYYTQEIFQRGRLERGRRGTMRWNAFLSQELKKRNEGMFGILSLCYRFSDSASRAARGGTKAQTT